MLNFENMPLNFQVEAVSTTCFVQNRNIIHKRLNKTPYKGLNNHKQMFVSFIFLVASVFVVNNKEHLSKFASKSDEGIFLGYSTNKVAQRVLIQRTRIIEEIFDMKFNDFDVQKTTSLNETKFIMANNIPTQSGPLNIIDVNYNTLFDPLRLLFISYIRVSDLFSLLNCPLSSF